MALQPGSHLGPYTILTPLGAGGMGEVFRARHAKLLAPEQARGKAVTSTSEAPAQRRLGPLLLMAAGGLVVGAALTWLISRSTAPAPAPAPSRSVVAVQADGAPIRTPVVSPDGRSVAVESRGRLWLHRLDQWAPRELPGTEGGGSPFWARTDRPSDTSPIASCCRSRQAGDRPRPSAI